jgi:hypothetical protein
MLIGHKKSSPNLERRKIDKDRINQSASRRIGDFPKAASSRRTPKRAARAKNIRRFAVSGL